MVLPDAGFSYKGKTLEDIKQTYVYTFDVFGEFSSDYRVTKEEIVDVEKKAFLTKQLAGVKVSFLSQARAMISSKINKDSEYTFRMNPVKAIKFYLDVFGKFYSAQVKNGKASYGIQPTPGVLIKDFSYDEEIPTNIRNPFPLQGHIKDGIISINAKNRPSYITFDMLHECAHLVLQYKLIESEINEKEEFLADYFARSVICHFNMFLKTLACSGFCFLELSHIYNIIPEQCILRYLDMTESDSGMILFSNRPVASNKTDGEITIKKELLPQEIFSKNCIRDNYDKYVNYGKLALNKLYTPDEDDGNLLYAQGYFSDLEEEYTLDKDYFYKAYKNEDAHAIAQYILFFTQASKDNEDSTLVIL